MLGLVTAKIAASLDPDLLPLDAAMRARLGEENVRIVAWDDPAVDWSDFDAVILRSTWDYADRLPEFLDWVSRVDAATSLINGAAVVRWSTDKRYLLDLAEEGIEITPTVFVAPGEPAPDVTGLHVVKPAIGAGSNGARRCESDEVAAHVALLHSQGHTAMVQPYLERLDELGETAHCFVVAPGATDELMLSHAFRKGAILTSTDVEQKGGLFAKEEIDTRTPGETELDLARRALDTDVVRGLGPIAFARVDVAPHRSADGVDSFVVMELELIEPSFYFDTNPVAVDAFADGLTAWLAADGQQPLAGVI